jgi:excisionase family DNA binding protein
MTATMELMKTGQVAKRTGLSVSTIQRCVERGELQAYMRTPGGHYKFREEDVQAFLAERQGGQRDAAA